mgnify:CR=1 FL=1
MNVKRFNNFGGMNVCKFCGKEYDFNNVRGTRHLHDEDYCSENCMIGMVVYEKRWEE